MGGGGNWCGDGRVGAGAALHPSALRRRSCRRRARVGGGGRGIIARFGGDVALAERAGVLDFQPGIHTALVELMSVRTYMVQRTFIQCVIAIVVS